MRNHITLFLFGRYSASFFGYSTRNRGVFRELPVMVGAEEKNDPETLVAGVGASTAEWMILSSAVGIQKE